MMKYRLVIILLTALISACDQKQASQAIQSHTKPIVFKDDSVDVSSYPKTIPALPESIPSPVEITPPVAEILTPLEYSFAQKLTQAATERTTHEITYDGRYVQIDYPMGDVPKNKGVCTDVVIRSYRSLGIDLQQLLHEDIRRHFNQYPNQSRWGLTRPDANIDHRRVPNLRVFFSRFGESFKISKDPADYLPGDLVTWKLNQKMVHIGIVSEQQSLDDPDRHQIVHNIGDGPEISDILFDFEITGHYRYHP